MKIATYNLNFLFGEGTHLRSGKEWVYSPELVAARTKYFVQRLVDLNADVLLLQEVASESVLHQVIVRSGIDYRYFLATPDDKGIGNAVLYRAPDAVVRSIPPVASLPVLHEGDVDTLGPRVYPRRDLIYLVTSWNGRPLHLINLHLKSNFLMAEQPIVGDPPPLTTQTAATDGIIRSEFFRLAQAKRVRQLVDELFAADPEALVVAGGDFNADEPSGVFRIIRGALKKANDALVPTSQAIPADQRYSHIYRGGTRILVDHLLVSKPLEPFVVRTQIVNDGLTADDQVAPTATLVGSDHAPVVLELNG